MYIIVVSRQGTNYYLVEYDHRYIWVARNDGLRRAARFRTYEAAMLTLTGDDAVRGVPAKVVPAPRELPKISPVDNLSPLKPESEGRFIICTGDGSDAYYVLLIGNAYVWRNGEPAKQRACRFPTRKAAQAVINSGHRGAAGRKAQIVELDE